MVVADGSDGAESPEGSTGSGSADGGPVGRPAGAGRAGTHPAGLDGPLGPAPARPRAWRSAALVVALSAAAGVALSTAFVGVGPAAVDRTVLGEAIEARSDPLTALAVAVTNLGSTAAMGVLAALVTLWLLRTRRPHDAIFVGVTAAGASLVFSGFKRVLDRARPPQVDQLVGAANESLPSGHATMSVAVIGSLVVLAWAGRTTTTRVAMLAVAALWVGAVGLTRIYLGVHWFSDVIAGWLVGGAWLALCATVAAASARRRAAVTRPPR